MEGITIQQDSMSKQQIIIRVVILVAVIGLLIFMGRGGDSPKAPEVKTDAETISSEISVSPRESESYPIDIENAMYQLGDRSVSLVSGVSSMPAAPDSETVMKVSLLNGPAFADIDGDNTKDAVVVLRDEPGGSGVFYNLSVLLSNKGQTKSTNSVLLGDRIRISSIEIMPLGMISVQILERNITDPMTATPTVPKLKIFQVREGVLTEVK